MASRPPEADRAKASEIMRTHGDNLYDLRENIARALAAARIAPPGHVIDDQGVVRRIEANVTSKGTGVTWLQLDPAEAARKDAPALPPRPKPAPANVYISEHDQRISRP